MDPDGAKRRRHPGSVPTPRRAAHNASHTSYASYVTYVVCVVHVACFAYRAFPGAGQRFV
ncbi:hypothetical protein [Kitasatospora sp. NPDC050543]|uniref:hypothetical protein n=1 Tax=Kitasatospora sp. NPDC050543 TaxID=3364054 RepID=UPI00379064BF